MSELFNNDNKKTDTFEGLKRNEDIDLSSFVTNSNDNSEETRNEPTSEIPVPTQSVDNSDVITSTNDSSNDSLLEKELQRRKEEQVGLTVDKDHFTSENDTHVLKNFAENDERIRDINKYQEEEDLLLKKRKAIVPLKQFDSSADYIQMVHEISNVEFDENGKPYYHYEKDDNGNRIIPSFIRLRTEDDPPYSKENDFFLLKREELKQKRINNGEDPDTVEKELSKNPEDIKEEEKKEDAKESADDEKKKLVNVIIDKTGLGANVDFTPEERLKLDQADEIKLTSVEVLDIASIDTVRPENQTFTNTINKYQMSGDKTTVLFPSSGFKADLSGMSYGEIGDILMDTLTPETFQKRLSVIYNKMSNISRGPFESFDEFTKNFAYTDVSLAVYGLFVSTFPEIREMPIQCTNESCGKTFNWKYSTREILKLEESSDSLLKKMDRIAAADPTEYDAIFEDAPVHKSKFIRLPYSGYIIEVGVGSCYNYLNNVIPLTDEDTFAELFGDDESGIYRSIAIFLTVILSVRVPNPDKPNSYILYEDYENMIRSLYALNASEIKIITAVAEKLIGDNQIYFALTDIKCPHCGHEIKRYDIESIDDMVFMVFRQLMTTEIDLTSIPGL